VKSNDMPNKGDHIRFRNNIVQIFSSGMLSQGIVVLGTLILTRFYNPSDFGILSVFTANFALLAGLFVLKYDLSIIAQTNDDEAISIAVLCVALSAVLSGLLFVGLLVTSLMGWLAIERHYLLLPVATCLAAICASMQQCRARQRSYKRYSFSSITNATLSTLIPLILIWYFPKFREGLIVGMICGWIGSTLMFTIHSELAKLLVLKFKTLTLSKITDIAFTHKYFPIYVLPISLLIIFSTSGQFLILNHFFSPSEVGSFGIAFRFLLLPMSTIGFAVYETFRSEFARQFRQKTSTKFLFQKTLVILSGIGIIVFFAAYVLSPRLFPLLLGGDYAQSGALAQYLCLGMFAQFISQPFMNILITSGRLGVALTAQLFATTLPLSGLLLGSVAGNLHLALLYYSIAAAITSISVVVISYLYSQKGILADNIESRPI
jgi:O-antigen/teichoic acid export membrane protein